jgi:signal peptidase II
MRAWILFASLAVAGFALDLATKHLATTRIPYQEEIVIVENYFAFGHIYNEGIIFGKWNEAKPLWLVVSVLAVPAIVAIFAAVKKPGWILTVSLGLVLGGTLGNLYDRAAFGKVRDFIKFSYDAKHVWPLFNLADAYICVGVVLLSVEMVFFDEKKKAKRKEAEAARAAAAAKANESPQPQPQPEAPAAPTEPMPRIDPPGSGPGPVDGDRPAAPG